MKHKLFIRSLLLLGALALAGNSCSLSYPSSPKPAASNETGMNSKITEDIQIKNSARLDLSNQGLKQLPGYVLTQTDTEELNVSHNNLTGALPGEIRFLKNLKKLDASYNQMTGVPAEIGQLTELVELNLSYNQFTGLPYELGNLKKLQVLNLAGNAYAEADLNIILQGIPNVTVIK